MSSSPPRHRPRPEGAHSLTGYFLCAALLAAAGCTTLQTVDQSGAAHTIEPGDTVVVTMRDGRELGLAFGDWTDEALTGTDEAGILQKIDREDIARVEVRRYSVLRSIGVGAVVAGVALAAASDSSDVY